jgi:hypothetical protein
MRLKNQNRRIKMSESETTKKLKALLTDAGLDADKAYHAITELLANLFIEKYCERYEDGGIKIPYELKGEIEQHVQSVKDDPESAYNQSIDIDPNKT